MLQLEELNTEAFACLWDFRQEFDEEFKVTIGALTSIETGLEGDHRAARAAEVAAAVKGLWHNNFSSDDVGASLGRALANASRLGIVHVHSAVDDFLDSSAADLDRWANRNGKNVEALADSDDEAERVEDWCRRRGLETGEFSSDRSLLRYFRVLRDCIVHRSARASRGLCECSVAAVECAGLAAWRVDPREASVVWPSVSVDEPIVLPPRHTILCLDVLVGACRILDSLVRARLGISGIAYLAAYYSLLCDDHVPVGAATSPEAAVNNFLHARNRAHVIDSNATAGILRGLGISQECAAAWNIAKRSGR